MNPIFSAGRGELHGFRRGYLHSSRQTIRRRAVAPSLGVRGVIGFSFNFPVSTVTIRLIPGGTGYVAVSLNSFVWFYVPTTSSPSSSPSVLVLPSLVPTAIPSSNPSVSAILLLLPTGLIFRRGHTQLTVSTRCRPRSPSDFGSRRSASSRIPPLLGGTGRALRSHQGRGRQRQGELETLH